MARTTEVLNLGVMGYGGNEWFPRDKDTAD